MLSGEEGAWLSSLGRWAASIPRRLHLEGADVEDAVNAAFLIAISTWSAFKPMPGIPEEVQRRWWIANFVWKVSARMCARRDRDRKLQRAVAERGNVERAAESHEASVLSREILRSLEHDTTPSRWRVWTAYHVDELSIAEIARQEGRPVATIYTRLRLARLDFAAALRREAASANGPFVSRRPRPVRA